MLYHEDTARLMMQTAIQVVFVEDDSALRRSAVQALELDGFAVSEFADAPSALREISSDFAGVVVTDVRMPRMDGIEFVAHLREIDPHIPVILTTAHADIEMAVEAMRQGAADFFSKPYAISRLAHSIRRAAGQRSLVLENRSLRRQLDTRASDDMVGVSPASERLHRTIMEVARTETDLLLAGAAGTGKSHLARVIHERSSRRSRPLVVVDPGIFANEEVDLLLYGRAPSAALSRSGLVERANGGTLVLEEIEQIPERSRSRLISLLDNRSFYAIGADRPRGVDIRVIGTTLCKTGQTQEGGGLRSRLSGITITVPTLAERQQDVPAYFRDFVSRYERELGRQASELDEADLRHLLTHDWPGNLRELQRFAQNFVLGLTRIAAPETVLGKQLGLRDLIDSYERSLLEKALRDANGNIQDVQNRLSIARKTLYDKLAKHELRPADFRNV